MTFIQNKVYHSENLNFSIDEVAAREEPEKVLMATPDFFDIIDVKNPHMEGNAGRLDKSKAKEQWLRIKSIYQRLMEQGVLKSVLEIKGAEGCEDMVFAANQTFPWITKEGDKVVVISKMRHASRQKEVPHFEKFFKDLGYQPLHLKHTDLFEGMGDTIPHYGKWLLYGGYGHRSKKEAYEEIAELLQVPVVALELVDEQFYHLDTCFVPVDENSVLICKEAFSAEGLACIRKLFKKVIEIPVEEASEHFSLNAHLINDKSTGKKVAVIQKGGKTTIKTLQDAGYQVEQVDTSEYIKSGGSVFCMKMMLY